MHLNKPLSQLVALLTRQTYDMQSLSLKVAGFADVSLRQIAYLEEIARRQNPTPTELAQAFNLSKPTISTALDRLKDAGYIRKVRSDEDRRSYHLHLTEKGEKFTQAHDEVHRRLADLLTTGLEEHEIEQLARLAEKISLHLSHPSDFG